MLLYVNKLYYFICRYNDKLINYVGFFTLHEIAIFIIVMKFKKTTFFFDKAKENSIQGHTLMKQVRLFSKDKVS